MGGSSRIHAVQKKVEEFFGKTPSKGVNPGAGFDPTNMGGAGQQGNAQQGGDDNVTDVDYEEVK